MDQIFDDKDQSESESDDLEQPQSVTGRLSSWGLKC